MGGALKAGILFGLIGLILSPLPLLPLMEIKLPALLTFVLLRGGPIVVLLGPLALILGGLAGFFGARWSRPVPTIGRGVLAGGVAGSGVMLGNLSFFVVILLLLSSVPGLQDDL